MSDVFDEIKNNFKAQVENIRKDLGDTESVPDKKKKQVTYRIKTVGKSDGKTEYYPQYKFLFLWFTFEDSKGKKMTFDNFFDARKFIEYKHKLKRKKHIKFIPVEPRED